MFAVILLLLSLLLFVIYSQRYQWFKKYIIENKQSKFINKFLWKERKVKTFERLMNTIKQFGIITLFVWSILLVVSYFQYKNEKVSSNNVYKTKLFNFEDVSKLDKTKYYIFSENGFFYLIKKDKNIFKEENNKITVNKDILRNKIKSHTIKIIPLGDYSVLWKWNYENVPNLWKTIDNIVWISSITRWLLLEKYVGAIWLSDILWFIFTIFIYGFLVYFLLKMTNIWNDGEAISSLMTKEVLDKKEIKYAWNKHLVGTFEDISKLYKTQNVETLKWILLWWPPWTGKTLFWKYLAKNLWMNFYYISANDFKSKFYSWTGTKIKKVFNHIRKELQRTTIKNAIIFIDELDSIGQDRNTAHEATWSWLNQLLTEIDGFKSNDGIIVMGATNRMEILDKALLSRFDIKTMVPLPNKDWRFEIIKSHLDNLYENRTENWYISIFNPFIKNNKDNFKVSRFYKKFKILDKKYNEDMVKKMSILTEQSSWRDIAKIIDATYNKAIIKEKEINFNLLWEAYEESLIGKDMETGMNDKDLTIIAYHELWHALLWKLVWHTVYKIAIWNKSISLWQTFSTKSDDNILHSKEYYLNEVKIMLAGRLAEQKFIGKITYGSQNDYERATQLLKQFFLLNFEYTTKDWKKLKLWYIDKWENLLESEKQKIMEYIKIIIEELEEEVYKQIEMHKDVFDKYVNILKENKFIMGDEFEI